MEKDLKKYLILTVIFLFLSWLDPQNAYAINESTEIDLSDKSFVEMYKKSNYDYVIDQYHVNILVNENNTFNITETITVYFYTPKHGIIRTIPLKNKIKRPNGTTSANRAKVSGIRLNDEFSVTRNNGTCDIRIGSKDTTISGWNVYQLKYKYDIGKDPLKNSDEFYFNIIGDQWDTVIGKVTFDITMPKEFDSGRLGFSAGASGSAANDNIRYTVYGNTISGSYNDTLRAGEALTVRCELPEGYFIGAGRNADHYGAEMFLIPLLLLGISVFIWYQSGSNRPAVISLEYYPPEGFNSLEIGFLYKGKANERDVISLLIYLADQGYIKISETGSGSAFLRTKGFTITKLKPYDGKNMNERIFLCGLFKNGKDEVTSKDLHNEFYITVNRILSDINSKENKDKIMGKAATGKRILFAAMMAVTCMFVTIPLINTDADYSIFNLISLSGVTVAIVFIIYHIIKAVYLNGKVSKSGFLILFFVFIIVCGFISELISGLSDINYLIGYMIGLCCAFGMAYCMDHLPERTAYGNKMLGKIKGFREYLKIVEKDKLEAMVMENPEYFYNILPYTYVLGLSDRWVKKFESITIQAPSWYNGNTFFDMAVFGAFMSSTMKSVQTEMTSSPSDSSGSDSSGGGCSGGGSGGGGGSSW